MNSIASTEPHLFQGLLAVLALCLVGTGMDVWRRATGRSRRATSPVRQWAVTTIVLWGLAAIAVWAWTASGRTLEALGFSLEPGWLAALSWAMAAVFLLPQLLQLRAVSRDPEMRDAFRTVVFESGDYDQVMPRRRRDVWGYQILAVTAGITEEIVFRAFLISVFALWMPVWVAAGLALFIFIVGHAYQGWKGFLRILPVSLALTLIYVLSGSLWPGILLHVAVDVLSGCIIWRLLPREGYVQVPAAAASANAQPGG